MLLTAELRMPLEANLPIWNKAARQLVGIDVEEVTENSIVFLHRIDLNYVAQYPIRNVPNIIAHRMCRGVIVEVDDYEEQSFRVVCADNENELITVPNLYLVDADKHTELSYDIWLKHLSMARPSATQQIRPFEHSSVAIGCRYNDWLLEKREGTVRGKRFSIQIVDPEGPCLYGVTLPSTRLISMCNVMGRTLVNSKGET